MLAYPVDLTCEGDTVLVTVPDLPGTQTFGDDEAEALARAVDAIETMLMGLIADRTDIPAPSRPRKRQKTVTLPALTAAKVALYSEMRHQRIGEADLARRMQCHLPQIDRLLDLSHSSKLDPMEAAFAAIGKRLAIHLEDAA